MGVTFVYQLLPLYLLIFVGYLAGRHLDIHLNSIARINIFILMPLVAFGAILRIEFDPAYILLPFVLSAISLFCTFAAFQSGKKIWNDGNANLLGAGSTNGNSIYFGLPIILALFGPQLAGVYLFMNMGPSINNLTVSYYLTSRGRHSVLDSFKRVLRFPAVHATWLAIVLNLAGVAPDHEVFNRYWEYAAGSMVFLGMMMIGIALSRLDKLEIDWALTGMLFLTKFALWPFLVLCFVLIDKTYFSLFSSDIYQVLIVFSVMPLIGNLVAYAAEFNLHPERAASAVLASSVFVCVSLPFAFALISFFNL